MNFNFVQSGTVPQNSESFVQDFVDVIFSNFNFALAGKIQKISRNIRTSFSLALQIGNIVPQVRQPLFRKGFLLEDIGR